MNKQVQALVDAHNRGQLSRRDFIRQAALLLGGAAVGGAVLANMPVAAQSATQAATDEATQQADADELVATLAATADPNIKLVTKMVEYDANGEKASGYLAYPEGDGPYPAVIILQEWWGLDKHIKAVTELMARFGFAALAPDLYHGQVAEEPNDAQKLAMGLIMDKALNEVQAAADYLTQASFVTPKKVGIVGFCMGGGIAFRMAWAGKDNIAAVVSLYGPLTPQDEANFKDVKVPVLGLYGEEDKGVTPNVERWDKKLHDLGKTYEKVIYPNAAHAFFNNTRPSYNENAATDALQQILNWLNKYVVDVSATPEATSNS